MHQVLYSKSLLYIRYRFTLLKRHYGVAGIYVIMVYQVFTSLWCIRYLRHYGVSGIYVIMVYQVFTSLWCIRYLRHYGVSGIYTIYNLCVSFVHVINISGMYFVYMLCIKYVPDTLYYHIVTQIIKYLIQSYRHTNHQILYTIMSSHKLSST